MFLEERLLVEAVFLLSLMAGKSSSARLGDLAIDERREESVF